VRVRTHWLNVRSYNVVDDKIGCIVSAYKDERNASQFTDALKEALDSINTILLSTHSLSK
jgi:hypothetical protein